MGSYKTTTSHDDKGNRVITERYTRDNGSGTEKTTVRTNTFFGSLTDRVVSYSKEEFGPPRKK